MAAVVVYQSGDGVAVCWPGVGVSADDVAASDVPAGAPHRIIDSELLPDAGPYREAWVVDWEAEEFAISVDPVKKEEIDKKIALDEIEEWFASAIDEGFQADGFRLGMSMNDVTLLTGNYVLAKEAAALGAPIPPVIDRDGVAHQMESIEDLTALMLAYGQYRAQLSAEYSTRKAALAE